MKRQLSLEEYRAIDLALFAAMLAIFEFLIVRFTTFSYYTVSLAAVIAAVVYMRWGWWGAIHAALAGILFCFYYSGLAPPDQTARWTQYIIYVLGNLFSLAAVPVLKRVGEERVRKSTAASLLFSLSVILLMQGGRAVVALVLRATTPAKAFGYFTADALSILFTLVVTWIIRRLDGVFEEQRHYLARVQAEREQERSNTEQ